MACFAAQPQTPGRSITAAHINLAIALGVRPPLYLPLDHHLLKGHPELNKPQSTMHIPSGIIPLALASTLGAQATSQHVLHSGQHPLHGQSSSSGELKVAVIGAGESQY